MDWFETKPDEKQVDKFYGNFLELLEKLRVALELKPNEKEMLGGFEV